ncbi:hypothetical protein ACFV1L_21075 [Kitasatospora sp. NPDC059646]|uniref:hypothetical protein n=1 Tax=Kitasatospora sp. NPDC059646 TaxID=3346893 RepID=UPI00367DA265
MSSPEFASASVQRAWEPPEEVVVPYALAYSPGLQPEDYGVLIRLLLRDPGQPSGMLALSAEFQATGWKMGESRLRGVMSRLQRAGHVSHVRDGYDEKTKRPKWKFMVYRNPANNSAYVSRGTRGVEASSQVRPMVRNPTHASKRPGSETAISNVCAGQTDTAISNASKTHALESGALESNVCAVQADTLKINVVPHLQEEVTTSSPNPRSNPTGPTGVGAREEEMVFDPEETTAAVRLLQLLPAPWTIGRPKAKSLAPALLEAMADQGWPRITTLDDRTRRLLVGQLTKNPGGIKNYGSILERDRIPNLPLAEIVLGFVPGQSTGESTPPQQMPKEEPDFKPVPAPARVAELLNALNRRDI